jgi:hypothetical protein
MRGFHVVFQLRIHDSGTLIFWDDDGYMIRRNGQTIHADRSSHLLTRHQIEVRAGDRLEVAQWQHNEGWLWGALLVPSGQGLQESTALLLPYLSIVRQRLEAPNGPPLKMYFHGATPMRTVLAIYSMILNGYSPSGVLVFGEYQWSEQSREVFTALLPFAHIVRTEAVLARLQSLGQPWLIDLARQHWFVMKTCIGLLCPPTEFCFMDDDIFILDGVDEALKAFQQRPLVFAQDADYSAAYLAVWGSEGRSQKPLPTGTLNTGLYWLRNSHEPRTVVEDLLSGPPNHTLGWLWEQGFMASQYAHEDVFPLPTQRYFYPYFDGLPGGTLGYGYARNPCGFVSLHFGGLARKPSDAAALILAPDILNRSIT